MLASTVDLLQAAREGGYAVGAFNVYNLEGVRAVVSAAEAERSPVMLQLHPGALAHGQRPLIALCLAAARDTSVPVSVHLDHSTSASDIRAALDAGVLSIMADGSAMDYPGNVSFVRDMVSETHARGGAVEAELGRLSGTEDGLTVPEYEALLTDPALAGGFVSETRVDALAVCVGNVHGRYRGEPSLDFDRLAAIRQATNVPLVLHGASGLPEEMVRRSIQLGVCKLNVNTEVRQAYVRALRHTLSEDRSPDLVHIMDAAVAAMQSVVTEKLRLFNSAGRV